MSLLIKLQKVRRMIKDNGLRSGGKIVVTYLGNYLKSFFAGTGDILFVTGGVGDKAHYRANGVAEELEHHGFRCAVTNPDNPRLSGLVDRFQVFVFHKVTTTDKVKCFVEKIKEQKKEIIFDTDDLDFDPQYLKYMDYYSALTAEEKKEYDQGIGAEILKDPYVKVATTTTSYLAEKLRARGKKVFVVSNKTSDREAGIVEKILAQPKKKDGFVRLGYYSGTPSHNKDFATITDVLVKILEKYKNTRLILAGPLDVNDSLNNFTDRIEVLPRVPRDEFYSNLAKCDINLSPLEYDNPFCEAKSEIRFSAAGILGIPTVAVRNQTFSEAISDGETGFLAGSKEEWTQKIKKLILDETLRRKMGEKAREKVLKDYTNKNSHSEEYYGYLREIIKPKP